MNQILLFLEKFCKRKNMRQINGKEIILKHKSKSNNFLRIRKRGFS